MPSTLLVELSTYRSWKKATSAELVCAKGPEPVHLPDANTRLQAVDSGHGIALLDELAKPEIESGQLVGVSDIFLEDFAYYLIPGLKQQLSASASNFQSWLESQPFA